jgi:FPC/CPF motif-containing protein YcgG
VGCLTAQQAASLYTAQNPFVSARAYAGSNYSMPHDGTLVRLLDWREPSAQARLAHNAFRAFVNGPQFACVAAKAAVRTDGYRFGFYDAMNSAAAAPGLARDLCAFAAEFSQISGKYRTFVAVFGQETGDEREFERELWSTLQRLRDLDAPYHDWDSSVSCDPRSDRFAFSFAGMAFFVVGLHPNSSRASRRFSRSALAFNAHAQFRQLRTSGHFERISRVVRDRELALQGSLNPNLAEFGERSEARQYSGRAVEEQWRCPFRAR